MLILHQVAPWCIGHLSAIHFGRHSYFIFLEILREVGTRMWMFLKWAVWGKQEELMWGTEWRMRETKQNATCSTGERESGSVSCETAWIHWENGWGETGVANLQSRSTVDGTRRRGRSRTKWLDDMRKVNHTAGWEMRAW